MVSGILFERVVAREPQEKSVLFFYFFLYSREQRERESSSISFARVEFFGEPFHDRARAVITPARRRHLIHVVCKLMYFIKYILYIEREKETRRNSSQRKIEPEKLNNLGRYTDGRELQYVRGPSLQIETKKRKRVIECKGERARERVYV